MTTSWNSLGGTARTAADIVAAADLDPAPAFTPPTHLGSGEGSQVFVGVADLADVLISVVDSGAIVGLARGEWTVSMTRAGIAAQEATPDRLAGRVIPPLRTWAADPKSSASPADRWLVTAADNTQLRRWLHIPA